MSTQTQEATNTKADESMGTKPVKEHEWLQKLVGTWRTETEMSMGSGQPKVNVEGQEKVKIVGGLWAYGEGTSTMPGGTEMQYFNALGYDVSFKEYRGSWIMSASSHLWYYTGALNAGGRSMTLDCKGPSMTKDGETANYRNIINIVDDNHHTITYLSQDENGKYQENMKTSYTRV